ncbi:dicarboxylate/amino acid:cation symporter [Ketogulonicigenium vulgare]|uniref:C4-dicarboxylate transport protein n=1 Tax=Ketogulonicigenium vulgare (strain WSH-001) TaxID=759362 RepID=F9Y815_KETVW|nr:dicarboxylate/amino acid:cation symporter [Ketogulonicigenium vulgare]ADO42955.1 sodium:dicarboxylate symporter [Ketogulonicigenium vulgare Y25]AEM41141.1 C4-dicarboxylate transport protein [Ketogulonicigenium vulgare WSH-001]ALJ81279.1 C4-dicarboxylate transporter [Ketogulonicigenium vulgare]ANW34018.1 C4-dicarboxylate transporter DctA [Ketogulonicigenium vulgare]AOZ54863.1 sodium:dicarboxylate symporter [Ketogulonicigenium vulgare]
MLSDTASTAGHGPRPFYRHLYFQVIVAIVLGALIGHLWPTFGASLKPLGDGFIKLVKMIIAPVIFITIVTGLAGMRDLRGVGSVAGKAFGYFLVFSTLALIVGLIVANVVRPGAGMNIDPATLDGSSVANYASQAHDSTLTGFLLDIIPNTMVGAFTQGNIIQVLFVAILFGVGIILVGERAKPVVTLLEAAGQVVFRIVDILMKAAPVGAFGAFAFTIGAYGIGTVVNLAALVGTFYLTAAVFVIVILGTVCAVNGFSIFRLISYLKAEILLVLGTSSSESALPSLMEKMEKAGCARPVVGLVVPTGYSFNLDGTNIYMTLAALFIAQATNIDLSLGDQIMLLLVAMLSSKGAAGVTGAGFITLAATLSIVPSVPIAGMAIILGVDRFMSECRSITNFIGNAVATVVVSRWEGQLDTQRLHAVLGGHEFGAKATPVTEINAPAGLNLGEKNAD